MAGGSYGSMASMMGGSSGQSTVPTQTFNAANFIGTPVPQVGDNAGRPNYAAGIGSPDQKHVVFVVVGLIAIGYLAFHLNFEK